MLFSLDLLGDVKNSKQLPLQKFISDDELKSGFEELVGSNDIPTLLEPEEIIDINSLVIAKKITSTQDIDLKVAKEKIANEFKSLGKGKDLKELIKIADKYGVEIKSLKVTKDDKVVFTYNSKSDEDLKITQQTTTPVKTFSKITQQATPVKKQEKLQEALSVKKPQQAQPETSVQKEMDTAVEKESPKVQVETDKSKLISKDTKEENSKTLKELLKNTKEPTSIQNKELEKTDKEPVKDTAQIATKEKPEIPVKQNTPQDLKKKESAQKKEELKSSSQKAVDKPQKTETSSKETEVLHNKPAEQEKPEILKAPVQTTKETKLPKEVQTFKKETTTSQDLKAEEKQNENTNDLKNVQQEKAEQKESKDNQPKILKEEVTISKKQETQKAEETIEPSKDIKKVEPEILKEVVKSTEEKELPKEIKPSKKTTAPQDLKKEKNVNEYNKEVISLKEEPTATKDKEPQTLKNTIKTQEKTELSKDAAKVKETVVPQNLKKEESVQGGEKITTPSQTKIREKPLQDLKTDVTAKAAKDSTTPIIEQTKPEVKTSLLKEKEAPKTLKELLQNTKETLPVQNNIVQTQKETVAFPQDLKKEETTKKSEEIKTSPQMKDVIKQETQDLQNTLPKTIDTLQDIKTSPKETKIINSKPVAKKEEPEILKAPLKTIDEKEIPKEAEKPVETTMPQDLKKEKVTKENIISPQTEPDKNAAVLNKQISSVTQPVTQKNDTKDTNGSLSNTKETKPITLKNIVDSFDSVESSKINDMAKKFFGDNVNAIKNIQQTPLEKAAETKKVQNETAEIEQETIQTTLKTTESVKTDATLKVQPKINLASILKINGNDSDDKKQNQKIKNEKLSLEDLKSEEASDNTLTKIRPFANEITSIKAGGLKQSIGLEIGSQNANSNNSPVKNEPTSSDETITIEEINIKNDPTNSRETIAARKETVSSFAHSLKKQIEEYKPPIMKVSLSLNPKNLGQVDVTIKQRGSKIEVNLTSNNHALQIFTNGSYDLKSALASLGYNAINMNLNDSSSQQEGRRDQGGHEKEQEEEKDELNITMEEETN